MTFNIHHDRHQGRAGVTLLEVTAASALLAMLLLPTASLMRQSSQHGRRLALRERMLVVADNLLETQRLAIVSGGVGTDSSSGDVTQAGISSLDNVRFESSRSSTAIVGLFTIDTMVWQDADGDRKVDNNEPLVHLVTQAIVPK